MQLSDKISDILLRKTKLHIIAIIFPPFKGRNILHTLYGNKYTQKVKPKPNEIVQYLFPISN